MQGEFAMPTTDRMVILPGGDGVIEPTDLFTDQEVLQAIDEAQKPVEDPRVVCMDERGALQPQPVRRKMAGGNSLTGFAAAAYASWSLFSDEQLEAGPVVMYNASTDHLVRLGAKIGGHGGKEVCGAGAKFIPITGNVVLLGTSEPIKQQFQLDIPKAFDEAVLEEVVHGATKFSKHPKNGLWTPKVMEEKIVQVDGVLEELNGKNLHPHIDPNNERHGHFGEALHINHDKDKSNDRDRSSIPFFQVDAPAIVEECERLATSDKEYIRLLHAAILFNYVAGFTLTKNMRVVR